MLVRDGKLVKTIDGNGPFSTFISLEPSEFGQNIKLTIGATHKDGCANRFDRESLLELISILTEVADVMGGHEWTERGEV